MKTIPIPEGYEVDFDNSTSKEIFLKKKDEPITWEEYEQITTNNYLASDFNKHDNITYDIFSTKEKAEAFCALGKLIQLRDYWVGNQEIDTYSAYFISSLNDVKRVFCGCITHEILTFPTLEMAEDFLKHYADLIDTASIFI